ncbi:YigZ family protein [Novibacillus thermophilus]|uniref:YigZ family protein n=1 Tax=Novibacillus thermophilus TaxID=1471761 RepID=A0A1U9KAP9_9BACL|nr:YigZ family protein [Novibacillus thermophilus]AQS57110.1 YigZ family protein [Novibacillus thermophilus]
MPYKTVAAYATDEITIEKSRFIAHVYPAPDEETAKGHIHTVSKKHWDATHNCYAYVIGENGYIQKANDDGEPSGTAGVPILETIKKNGLTDTLVIVTRYFGGIKLGAGGLVRAYTRSASQGLRQAQLVQREKHLFYELNMDYAMWNKVEQQLNKVCFFHDKTFTDKVTVLISVREQNKASLTSFFQKWGSHVIQYKKVKEDWVAVPL